ncbi:helix-turn-helix domain-containing protein [Streptomyces sp. NPDC054849]
MTGRREQQQPLLRLRDDGKPEPDAARASSGRPLEDDGFRWNLRRLMATLDMFQTTDLVPRLAEYGIHLSRAGVPAGDQDPQRLSMDTLAALRGILQCTPADLIEVVEVRTQVVKPAASGESAPCAVAPPARRSSKPSTGGTASRPPRRSPR